jgi:Rhs element Vgr protein
MPESPLANTSGVLKLTLSSDGTALDPAIGIASITITNAVNKIPFARIELHDGDMPEGTFPLSDGNNFDPGKKIKIEAGYGQDQEVVFEGIVIKHSIRISSSNDARLVVECRDEAVKLTVGRRNANFIDKTDSDVIGQLIGDKGLSKDVESTNFRHKELTQYYCSDWDYLLSRAETNGLLVITDSGKVSVKSPAVDAAPDLKLTYGDDLIELQADIDARTQFKQVDSVSWDPGQQQLATGNAPPEALKLQGDLDAKKLSEVLALDSFQLQTPAELEPDELKTWAKAQQVKSGLARVRGRMKFQGSARAKPGTLIELDGVGNHFNGNVFVSLVTHRIDQGNWITEAAFGLAPDWFAEQRDLMAPPASGLLPGVEGLQIGVVVKLDGDPENKGRIQVKLPVMQNESPGIWARLASYYASDGCGNFFVPEIEDEVLLGYLNSDPNNPVVLGSLYSSKRKAPYELTADNFTKAIVTRSMLKVEFDDDKKVISLVTPGGNQIVISDDGKSILLQDQNSNKVELNQDGITLDSPKDITIKAGGKIDINATGAISASSNADVSVKGMNVDCEAQTGFTAKGNATAELTSSGQTTVKGAMVMIN